MDMKYRITSETKVVDNITLHRIECVTAFGDVECGAKGGWIESEKNLSQDGNAWVGEYAMVFGNAVVRGYAVVSGNAWVYESAVVSGYAWVYDNAKVGGNARISGNAWIDGNAMISGNAWVYGNAKVGGNARISGNAWISEYARISEYAIVGGNAEVCGNALVGENAMVCENADYIVFKNWWSSGRYFTWTRSNNKWRVGCFFGTGEELIAKAYKDSEKSGREYERVVKYVNDILKEEENNDNGNRNKREG